MLLGMTDSINDLPDDIEQLKAMLVISPPELVVSPMCAPTGTSLQAARATRTSIKDGARGYHP
jgi:hypothetical protein